MTAMRPPSAPIRWWPACLILALGLAGLLLVQLGDPEDQQKQMVGTLLFGALLPAGLFLWLVLFSRLPGRRRARLAAAGGAGLLLFLVFFRVQGFTGNLLPILEPRFGGGPRLTAETTTAKVDISTSADDFPQFRGAARDGRVPGARLARDWAAQPPRELWRRPVGEGWSGFAVVGNLAITQEQREDQEVIAAYDAGSGTPVWSHAAPGYFENALGGNGPRATPTVENGQVFTFGPTGLLRALELSSGRLLWSRQAAEENGGKRPEWGYAGSPLLVGDLVVVVTGGSGGRNLAAYRRGDGEKVWTAGEDGAGYASPLLADLAGRRQIVVFGRAAVTGHDPADGRVLWSHPWSSAQANVAIPMAIDANHLLVSSGYGVGSALIEVTAEGDGFATRAIWQNNQMKAKFTNLVEHGGRIYGLDDGIFACLDPRTGERCWKGGRFGHGQILLAGGLILALTEAGEMVMVEPDTRKLVELGRFPALTGKSWNTFALSGSRLLVRNHQEAACFELPLAG